MLEQGHLGSAPGKNAIAPGNFKLFRLDGGSFETLQNQATRAKNEAGIANCFVISLYADAQIIQAHIPYSHEGFGSIPRDEPKNWLFGGRRVRSL